MSLRRDQGHSELAVDAAGVTELSASPEGFETSGRRVRRRFRKNIGAMIGLVMMGIMFLIGLVAPWIFSPDKLYSQLNAGPSASHWLGTNSSGQDILIRVLCGTRASLGVGVIVVILSVLIALPLGLASGYIGGAFDGITMRVMDALFAFPSITLAIVISGLLLSTSTTNTESIIVTGVAISITFVPGLVRILRSQVLAVREENFIEASRSVGVTSSRMVRKHVFPNVVSPLIVQLALTFGYAIIAEAGLSFLGFGVHGTSWGQMLQEGYNEILTQQLPILVPGLAIMFTVLAANLIADGLRDAMGRESYVREVAT
jgi:ABC-type dipeptide/oligopeptide/nickel transport system permease subunit